MATARTYLSVIGATATGFSAHCPDVPGCAAVGKTIQEAAANMKAALELHFEGLAEDGLPVPKPGGASSYRKVMKELDADHDFLAHVRIDTRRFAGPVATGRRSRSAS